MGGSSWLNLQFQRAERAHPCEHRHKSAAAPQRELKDLEMRQASHSWSSSCAITACGMVVTPHTSPLSRQMRLKGRSIYPATQRGE